MFLFCAVPADTNKKPRRSSSFLWLHPAVPRSEVLKNGTLNKRIALLCLLCTCIQLISGYPSCCSLVYGPFPDSVISIHEGIPNYKYQQMLLSGTIPVSGGAGTASGLQIPDLAVWHPHDVPGKRFDHISLQVPDDRFFPVPVIRPVSFLMPRRGSPPLRVSAGGSHAHKPDLRLVKPLVILFCG